MQKIAYTILLWSTIYTLSAQKTMDTATAREDFTIFESILKKGHPGLYEYIENDSLDYLFETTKESFSDSISDIELYKKMLRITDQIQDGHLMLFAPNTIKTEQYYFPLIVKIINTELYVDTGDFEIPIGSKILSINNREVFRIIEKLKKYVATDGYNLTKKYRDIELKFGLFYAYEYGIEKLFNIKFITPDGETRTIEIPSKSFVNVRLRNASRNSYFAKYHNQKNGFEHFNKFIDNKSPFVYYKEDLKTAVLVVNSFGIDITTFKSNLVKIFKEINKKKIKHLIIDIRNNDGGFRPNSIHLYSFVAKTQFKQILDEFIISLSVPEREYVTRTFLNEKEFLEYRFKNHAIFDGWKITFDDLEAIMVPDKNRFKGKVYVLTSGRTFSAGSTFALNAKNDPDITVIGEETGGGYYFSIGNFPVYYEFPNSKITMLMSMEKITNYVKDKTVPKGSGVLPDKHINLSVKDLITGKDPQLDYIFRLIGG
ncbi:S41 family peptidase [Aquimarina sp. 2201CG5-10]|uniref:S41 family peptidase n=1 Tax=Aquimarina callyspongiae TaxID=3098150 RepID=UPI002AB486AD|nr:S41 family peptidase [Aquimarina sp. 2201CG5-10]MDY8138163.1 S41 family peptidase [Aquimarina sp. 2201CG5-10]